MALKTPFANDAKTYGFEWLRYATEIDQNSEGVVNYSTDLLPTNAATGLKVDIAAGAAYVKGDSGTPGVGLSQGLYTVVNDAAIANAVTCAAADATNPRLDQVVLKVTDSQDLGDASDVATLEVLTGTPTGGATLDNRSGAAALTNNRLRIADVLVPATATNLTAANVRDRRLPANGFANRLVATSQAVTPGAALAMLATPDRVNLYVPDNAIVELQFIAYAAITTTTAGSGWAPFITDLATMTSTQLKAPAGPGGGAPAVVAGGASGTPGAAFLPISAIGSTSYGGGGDATEVTTGEQLTAAPVRIYGLPAGEYAFDMRYQCGATATLTMKNRRLWARVIGQGRSQ